MATFGEGCTATREAFWSVHVTPGIDPGRTDVRFVDVVAQPDGQHGTLVVTPFDVYGNPIGPGRGDLFTVSPIAGVTVGGGVRDRGDGSYGVGIVWDPGVAATPDVIVQQPDRPPAPVVLTRQQQPPDKDCAEPAAKLLECLGLDDPSAKRVRVKSVSVRIDLKHDKRRYGAC